MWSERSERKLLVSDNGAQFNAAEFAIFLKRNAVRHIQSAPYHPSSNGDAECFVQTFKRSMKTSQVHDTQHLMSFLLSYPSTLHATTNQSLCSLVLNRQVRTHLDLLHPNVEETVSHKQIKQGIYHDLHAHRRHIFVGKRVMAWHPPGVQWILGTIVEQTRPLSFLVQVRICRRHIDHLRGMTDSLQDLTDAAGKTTRDLAVISPESPAPSHSVTPDPDSVPDPEPTVMAPDAAQTEPPTSPLTPLPRYPQRVRRPPAILTYDIFFLSEGGVW